MWAFCTLSLLQAPAYPQMMRSVEKHLSNLPAELLCELINAIVPLGRAAACARLLPKLTDALAQASPKPPFELLLRTSRVLCTKAVLPEPLLLELRNAVTHACSNPAHVATTRRRHMHMHMHVHVRTRAATALQPHVSNALPPPCVSGGARVLG